MITPIDSNALKQALVEVRKAYRLLWMFQSRVFDICRELANQFDVEFYQTDFRNKPGGRGSNPLSSGNKWAMTPMQEMSLLFLSRDSSSEDPANYPRQGDYLIDVRFVADTGRDGFRNSDADPAKFASPDECATKLSLYIFVNDVDRKEPTQWYDKIWSQTEYPPHDSMQRDVDGIRKYGYEFDVSQLCDQEAIIDCSRIFVRNVREKIGINLAKP